MLRLSSDQLSTGMIVGRSIFDASGRMLLAEGQVLNKRYIQRIQDHNIPTIYIDEKLGIEDSPSPVNASTILNATNCLKESFQQCAQNGKINVSAIRAHVDNIIDDLISNSDVLIGMSDLKSYDQYTYQHSVNVAILALMMGLSNAYTRPQLQGLGIGAMLHDIGKMGIPIEILNKPGSLNDEEITVMNQHPWNGFNLIRESGEIALLSAHVALQHHERMDGSGYPRSLSGANIHEYAQITAVADVFDALISDRPYRPAFNNQEAINIIEEARGKHLCSEYVDLLLAHINLCPPGTVVLLNTKDIAIVTKENTADTMRPQIRLIFNKQQKAYEMDRVVDLAEYKTVFIQKTFSYSEGYEYISRFRTIHKKALK